MNKIRNYDKAAIKKADSDHHFHPFTDSKGLDNDGGARVIVRGEGCYLYDIDGEKILDGMAGLWCTNIGYGRDELADLAAEQMKELAYYNTFFKTTTAPAALLAEKLCSLLPDNFNHVFFSNSGSEANDTNLRLARTYWQHVGKPSKKIIISRTNAYHGSTVAGASLGGMSGMHKQAGLEIGGIEHVMQPYWWGEGGDMSEDEFGLHAAKEVEKKILEVGADNVAAFIGEPFQGAGGVIIPPKTYWPEINRICKEHDILLICDEVIAGFGRTGNWFGLETFGIEPDLMTMAKGLSSGYLPISATGVSDRVWEAFYKAGDDFNHGYTYSGHPVASVVAMRNLEIIEEEGLVEKVKNETGPYLAKRLEELKDHPIVGEVRSVGLVCAIELTNDKEARTRFPNEGRAGTVCRDHFFKRNVIMRACGDVMVASPPLIATKEEIDLLIDTARECLDATAKDLGVM
ncbi:aspartate aminotransferase family protein [Curvivirga aplysinae]|uniref:aspartate aminotransferase family protein n=1 Tax=Curvivirga aplysinae TaxID=2529852 RepID=UPI0012BB674D|nr:aspartate aminotransferase family protein [Curvivirga aplysinae]MTI08537.1 aspartate aminotransferase family protein [Curvivirga aplysinae]